MTIRPATDRDFTHIWPLFREIVAKGDTYAFAPNTTREEAYQLWMSSPRQTFVAEENGVVLGTYFIKTNQSGPGSHVCNCGYMVSSTARGKGIATQMCLHSQERALALGYQAMQFNFVVDSNVGAIRLWEKLGFARVGTVPKAFAHPELGLIGAHIMFKWLATE